MCLYVFYISYMFRAHYCLPLSFLPYKSSRFALCFYTDVVPPVAIWVFEKIFAAPERGRSKKVVGEQLGQASDRFVVC